MPTLNPSPGAQHGRLGRGEFLSAATCGSLSYEVVR
jgi:hypothetical protein